MFNVYQLEAEPVLFNVGLGVGLVLLLTEVVPCLSAVVGPQTPAGPVCWGMDFCLVDSCSCHMRLVVEGVGE